MPSEHHKTSNQNSLPINHLHFGPVETYGHFSLSPAHTGGTTRAFHGRITTTVSGIETILPTQTYLTYSPEYRQAIVHPASFLQASGYGHVGGGYENTDAKPIEVPPDAPPPHPPVDIKTGKPLTVRIATAGGSIAPSRALTVHSTKDAGNAGEGKRCSNCGHTSIPSPG